MESEGMTYEVRDDVCTLLSPLPPLSLTLQCSGIITIVYVGGNGNRRLNAGVMSVTLLAGEDSLPLSVGPNGAVGIFKRSPLNLWESRDLNRSFAGDNTL